MAPPLASWFSRVNRIRGTIWILKNTVMLINVLSLVSSVGFFAVGIYGYSDSSVVGIVSSSLPLACIILGIIVALISLIGVFSVANESALFIRVYFALLLLLILAEIIIGGVAFSHKDNVELYLTQAWTNAYKTDKSTIARLQGFFGCCGFRTVDDMAVRDKCMTMVPCYTKVKQQFLTGLNTMATVAVTLGVIELFCLLAAGLLVFFSRLSEDARNSELLEEARKLSLAEQERAKSKRYNFETPFEDGDD
ncbi:hypothetical protein H9P43_001770 [Blastocladiella emersonii ATCC 22665]|nr:hypothetical protein H9P43_001768 [Blastocladiella emersonii ATCC 22665]KAI9190336.1 hypothetical protein H9P43_001770 [Blastocladiella emersonii ATCC 22665]